MDEQNNHTPELVETDDAKHIVENLLFITDRPLTVSRIAAVVETIDTKKAQELVLQLIEEYNQTNRAIHIVELGGGFQMATKPEYGRWVRRLYNEKMTVKLSNAALETLAIVAYKQPATRAEIESIRGVDVAAPLERLLERGLVRVLGKKDTIGRPMVYGTTEEFLRMFGLNKLSELPDLQIFATKTVQEKQADLPFGDPLPPLVEPGIIALEDLDTQERLDALGGGADAFFARAKQPFSKEGVDLVNSDIIAADEAAEGDGQSFTRQPASAPATADVSVLTTTQTQEPSPAAVQPDIQATEEN